MRDVSSAFWLAFQQDGIRVCELIELSTPNGVMRWTSANASMVSSGLTYDPFPGRHGAIEESTDLGIGTVEFAAVNSGNLRALVDTNGLDVASMYIRRVLVNSPDYGTVGVFRGKLADFAYNRAIFEAQARNIFNGIANNWPIYTYQDTCVWRFGGTGCGFDTSTIAFTGSIVAGSSSPYILLANSGTITRSYAPGQLERGRVTITSGVNSGQVRTIRVHTGDLIGLSHPLSFPTSAGLNYSIYPGCRKRSVDCASKYNNIANFFAFPWMPKQEQAF